MAVAKSMQTPQILGLKGVSIRIRHPDISFYPRTYLRASIAAAGTVMTVGDNDGFIDDDWFIVGQPGDSTTEEDDVNGAVTRGTALTVTNSLKFGHNINDPVTRIQERKITIYGASTSGGSLTAIYGTGSAKNIQWDKPFTEVTLLSTDTTYAFYAVKFYDGTTESSASDYIASTGHGAATVAEMTTKALRTTNQEVDNLITEEFLIGAAQDCQDEIAQYVYQDVNGNLIKKDWSFEIVEDDTSIDALTMENRYALSDLTTTMKYLDSKQAIINVKFGDRLMKYIPPQEMDIAYDGDVRDELASATTVGATSVTLNNSTEFAESGTIKIGGDSITYTANAQSTGVLSGIPASGTGSITEIFAAGRAVWQGVTGGRPSRYTIFNNEIILDQPVASTYVGYRVKVKYLRALNTLSEMGDSTLVTFTNAFKWYISAQICYRKGQDERAEKFMAEFNKIVLMNAKGEKTPIMDTMSYLNFSDGNNLDDFTEDIRFFTN